jgi:(p)ppGpp synthase/HD superfamily hydrolase
MQKIFEAIEFAARAHSGQYRKGTKLPFILHPLAVAKVLIQYECAEEIVVAGILHDTLEDTTVTVEDLRRSFGNQVASLVEACSEPDKSKSWEIRKLHAIESLKIAPPSVLLIECADKLDNIRTIQEEYVRFGEIVWKRFNRSKEHQRWYYRALAQVFTTRITDDPYVELAEDFRDEVQKVFNDEKVRA